MKEELIHNSINAKKTEKGRKINQKNKIADIVSQKIDTRNRKAQPEEQNVIIARRRWSFANFCGFEHWHRRQHDIEETTETEESKKVTPTYQKTQNMKKRVTDMKNQFTSSLKSDSTGKEFILVAGSLVLVTLPDKKV